MRPSAVKMAMAFGAQAIASLNFLSLAIKRAALGFDFLGRVGDALLEEPLVLLQEHGRRVQSARDPERRNRDREAERPSSMASRRHDWSRVRVGSPTRAKNGAWLNF